MDKFYKISFWIIIVCFLIAAAMEIQKIHITGGTSGTYKPSSTGLTTNNTEQFGVFRLKNTTKPDVDKLDWKTATSSTNGKWQITIDDGSLQEFDTLEETNKALEKNGLNMRPLTTRESYLKWFKELF